MAGLPEYLGMGFGVAVLYIGVKYGPQIIKNLQQNQPAQAQTPPTSQTPASQDDIGQPVYNIPGPRHQNDTGTYPKSTQRKAAVAPPLSLHDQSLNVQPPNAGAIHPSNGPHVAPTPSTKPKKHKFPHSVYHPPKQKGPGPCPDGSYPDANNNCEPIPTYLEPTAKAYLGYFDSYNIPVSSPQYYKSIPYYQATANQGMVKQGRVRRALATNNSNFMPGGFVLSEASVRRGVNNVYSAGT